MSGKLAEASQGYTACRDTLTQSNRGRIVMDESAKSKAISAVSGDNAARSIRRWRLRRARDTTTLLDLVSGVAKADLKNIQAVAASQLAFNTKCFENDRSRARQSFRAAVGFAAVGLLFFVAAIITAPIKGHLSAAIISAVGGSVLLTISGLNFWLYGRASAQLNRSYSA
jgi:hypothetical protein